ncbi:hypothetical protein C7377_1320 [Balneicella halophila]|uniref:Uncharacterized protein n=1 Tax=Balneicella halophila TaxID=1537566 RepID=A0A7L4UP94_BALHA|nr:hypothetical protein C7377_1320 [Balneicella halophila]
MLRGLCFVLKYGKCELLLVFKNRVFLLLENLKPKNKVYETFPACVAHSFNFQFNKS